MATIDDLEQRLAELERWRDGEQRRLMQAIADTQSQHTRALVNLEREVGNIRLDLATVKIDVAETKVGVQTILTLLQAGSTDA